MLAFLLRHRLRLWRRQYRGGARGIIQALLLLFGGGTMVFFVFRGSSALFSQLLSSSPLLVEPLLSLTFGGFVLLGLLSGFSLMLYELFLRSDLEVLMAAPVTLRTLFGLKFLEGLVAVGAFAGVLGVTALAGYGSAAGAVVPIALIGLVVLGAILAITTALSMLGILLISRVMPPGRVRGALAVFGALFGAGIWLAIQIGTQSADDGASFGVTIGPLIETWRGAIWSPTTWAANALTSISSGHWATFGLDLGLLGALTIGLVALSYAAFARTFYLGHGRVSEVTEREAPTPAQLGTGRLRRWLGFLPPPMRAVAIKDWRTLRRDLRMLSQLIFPLVITGFFTYSLATGDGIGQLTTEMPDAARYWLFVGPIAFLAWFVVGSLSIYAFGWEGPAFALLRIGPLRPGHVLLAKGLTSFIPLMTVFGALAIAVGIWQGASLVQIALALVALAWILSGLLAIVTSAAALSTRFDAEHPQKSVGITGSLPPLLAGGVFILVTAVVVLRFSGVTLPFLPAWSNAVIGLILIGVLGGIGLLVRTAARRIEHWQVD